MNEPRSPRGTIEDMSLSGDRELVSGRSIGIRDHGGMLHPNGHGEHMVLLKYRELRAINCEGYHGQTDHPATNSWLV